jgi:peptide/nickel transport system ATP-binding protein
MAGSGKAHLRPGGDILLTVEDLTVEFKAAGKKVVKAVSGVSFDVQRGETLAVVGESGCGKSTLGKALIQLPPPKSGSVVFEGRDLTLLEKDALARDSPGNANDLPRPCELAQPTAAVSAASCR